MDLQQKIIATLLRIPRGRVATYGGIATLAGAPGGARLVGNVLKRAPSSLRLPWHRVINAGGRSSFPPESDTHRLQMQRLKREGVGVVAGRIDLTRYGWPAPRQQLQQLDELLWKVE